MIDPPADRLEEIQQLGKYHLVDCNSRYDSISGDSQRCSCGLDSRLAKVAQQVRELRTALTQQSERIKAQAYELDKARGQSCRQCGGRVDTETGRCGECDSQNRYFEAETDRLEKELAEARTALETERARFRDMEKASISRFEMYVEQKNLVAEAQAQIAHLTQERDGL